MHIVQRPAAAVRNRQVEGLREVPGLQAVQKYGSPALLLSWVPFIGDPLCVAAGWLRLNPWLSALFMGFGKLARYVAIASIA